MGDVETEQVPSTVVPGQARADKLKRLRQKAARRVTPSGLVKDVTVGGVAFVAIRITYLYLKDFAQRPDLLAGMGKNLIAEILGICVVGVLMNRGVDIVDAALGRTTDALDGALNRMANSSERAAESAAQGAIAQREIAASQQATAASQQAMALAQQQQTTVMERVAANGDNTMTQVQTLQNYQVSQGKIIMREQQHTQRMLLTAMKHMGVEAPNKDEDQDHA